MQRGIETVEAFVAAEAVEPMTDREPLLLHRERARRRQPYVFEPRADGFPATAHRAYWGRPTITAMEAELDVVGCLDGEECCRVQQRCVLRRTLRQATSAFLASLDRYTLADLIRPRHALARSLGIEACSPTLRGCRPEITSPGARLHRANGAVVRIP